MNDRDTRARYSVMYVLCVIYIFILTASKTYNFDRELPYPEYATAYNSVCGVKSIQGASSKVFIPMVGDDRLVPELVFRRITKIKGAH